MNSIQMRKVRDLTVWEWTNEEWIIFSADSLGGIGERVHDVYRAMPEDVGYFTARVGLFELLAAGATPTLLVDTLSVGGEYASRIITGIRDAVIEAGLPESFPITGSSEDNVQAEVTAVGLTLIGRVTKVNFRPGCSVHGDEVWLIGMPKSAPNDDVFREDKSTISFAQLREITHLANVHDILPIGSKGCYDEALQMARSAGLQFLLDPFVDKNLLVKSGGPATSVMVAGNLSNLEYFRNLQKQLPCTYLGILEDKK